jgi:uroporphyrinogen-III decarboxylase
MTTKERMMAALRCQPVDHVPMAFHFWHAPPRHPKATWRNERERLEFYRRREWDARVEVGTSVTPLPEVHVEVRYETLNDQPILHQVWHTPAGTVEERLRVTEDWPRGERNADTPVGFYDDFRTSRYIEFPFKSASDLATVPFLFPVENARDLDGLASAHRDAKALAEEFQVPLFAYHSAGMDWLIWLYPLEEIILRARTDPAMVHSLLDQINSAYRSRLEAVLQLGVDGVCRRGWYESADLWSPRDFAAFARGPLAEDIRAVHAAGGVLIYLMDTGVAPLLGELGALGFDCLFGVDPLIGRVDLREVRRALPGKSLWGGISATLHIGLGTPAETERAVERAFESCGRVGFVLGPLEGLRHNWPWENIVAFERAWRRLRKA